jgi:O-antigen ligase
MLLIAMPFLFFSISSIFSYEYPGFPDSKLYVFVLLTLFLLFFILHIFVAKINALLFHYLFPFFILFIGLLSTVFYNLDLGNFFVQYILFVLPAIFFSIYIGKYVPIYIFSNYFLFFCLINSLAYALVISKMVSLSPNELISFFGGGHYQGFAYGVSLTYLLMLIFFLFYSFSSSFWFKSSFILVFISHWIEVLLSGARGAFLVILVGTFVLLFIKFKFLKIFKIIIVSAFFCSLIIYIFSFLNFEFFDRFLLGFERVFSYLSIEGIDMSKTSNREDFYDLAIRLIKEKPFTGYGIFRYQKFMGAYPHNFFLEVLLQGGICLLFLWMLVLTFFFVRLKRLINSNSLHYFILAPVIYSSIQLMFSGSYLLEPLFWFSICYVFNVGREPVVLSNSRPRHIFCK